MIDIFQLQSQSQSQAGQDLFVICMLKGKKNGTFLEIGGGHPKDGNNTYLLETQFNWTGYSVDIEDATTEKKYNERYRKFWKEFYRDIKDSAWPECSESINDLEENIRNECINLHRYNDFCPKNVKWHNERPLTKFLHADATTLDYSFLPSHMDYLQIDIDPPIVHLDILELILPRTRFSTITFEHDLWRNTKEVKYVRKQSRKILSKYGYEIIANDVTIDPWQEPGINVPIYFEDWYVHPDYVNDAIIKTHKNITTQLAPKYFYDILHLNN